MRFVAFSIFALSVILWPQPSSATLAIYCGTGVPRTLVGKVGAGLPDFSSLSSNAAPSNSVTRFGYFVSLMEQASLECERLGPEPAKATAQIEVSGEIGFEDAEIFENLSKFQDNDGGFLVGNGLIFNTFIINSNGGDVYAAMKIGDFLFNSRSSVIVRGHCFSACVLLVSGSVSRLYAPSVEVGTHRIYLPGDATTTAHSSAEDVAAVYEKHFERIRAYLIKFGVSGALIDVMRSTPSSQIKMFSVPELEEFGLGADNVAYEELKRTLIERNCGEEIFRRYVGLKEGIDAACALVVTNTCALLIRGVVQERAAIEKRCLK